MNNTKGSYIFNWTLFIVWCLITPYDIYRFLTTGNLLYILLAGMGVFFMWWTWKGIRTYRLYRDGKVNHE